MRESRSLKWNQELTGIMLAQPSAAARNVLIIAWQCNCKPGQPNIFTDGDNDIFYNIDRRKY